MWNFNHTSWSTSGTITIASNIVDDTLDEVDETVIVTLSNPSNATLDQMMLTLIPSLITTRRQLLILMSQLQAEPSLSIQKAVTVDLSAASAKDITVDFAVTWYSDGWRD